MDKLFVCPRCDRYVSKMTSMGRWECCYHPGEYDVDTGFSCCGRKVRELNYNPTYVALGAREMNVREPKGCTPCDCGDNLRSIDIHDIAEFVDQIEVDKWKGFDFPTLYRCKHQYDTRSAHAGT